jgi:hypothetical protein
MLAHRASWQIHYGPIPTGAIVCHSCDNPKCVNPIHLWIGTQRDNLLDAIKKGRKVGSNSLKTHCINGHSFAEHGYTYPTRKKRACKLCMLEYNRKHYARHRKRRIRQVIESKRRRMAMKSDCNTQTN